MLNPNASIETHMQVLYLSSSEHCVQEADNDMASGKNSDPGITRHTNQQVNCTLIQEIAFLYAECLQVTRRQ